MSYFDLSPDLTWEDLAVRAAVHKFAAEVMRPIANELDRMSPEEVVAEGSPLYDFYRQAYGLGYHKAFFPVELGGPGFSPRQKLIAMEEMGWGSFGLSVALGVASFPFYFLLASGNETLIQRYTIPYLACTDGSIRGCWGITEPNHGSDVIQFGEAFFSEPGRKADVRAFRDGEEWVIRGQKSAWVSGATVATHCLLHVQLDESKGLAGGGVCIVPLDLPGVKKGRPLDKLGQRDLNQGELFFDEVRIPADHMLVGPDQYEGTVQAILAVANTCMGAWATGLARAALDESLSWVKDRVQGGKPLIEHYSMKQRIFTLFRRVELSRQMARAAGGLNLDNPTPFVEYSLAAKVSCTELAFANAHDAVQIFGGSGLSREYPVEKLFRDARAAMIEDGNNEVLARKGGLVVAETYPRVSRGRPAAD